MKKILLIIALVLLGMAACGAPRQELDRLQRELDRLEQEPDRLQEGSESGGAVEIGQIIEFGGYDWRVLEVEANYAKLLTENVIFNREYHPVTLEAVTWATSSIRAYLNGTFFNSLSDSDRARIRQTTVINSDNQWFGTSGGDNTTDKIFLLSIEEVVRYFGDSGWLRNRVTDIPWIDDRYNNARIARNAADTASWWWLRSPGGSFLNLNFAAYVNADGNLRMSGDGVSFSAGGVRPALWLNLES